MGWSLINSRSDGAANTFTSTGISTIGANFLAIRVSSYSGVAEPTLSDSESNTWEPGLVETNGDLRGRTWWVNSNTPNVGASHTFTLTGVSIFGAGSFGAWLGAAATPEDQEESTIAGSAESADCGGPITPSEDGCLIFAAISFNTGSSGLSVDSGLTVVEFLPYSFGNYFGSGFAWKEQSTAAAINPTFSWTTAASTTTGVSSFKPGTAPAGGSKWPGYQSPFGWNRNKKFRNPLEEKYLREHRHIPIIGQRKAA